MSDKQFSVWLGSTVGFTLAAVVGLIGAGVLDRVNPPVILLIALFVALASAGGQLGLFILDLIERQRP
ncbi:hypothetical protein [Methylobacterium oxalidis]|uniref:Uncharacterized protein n=1 Tax=Methylobacterium oxalidis TaxID=944322 RepID=A0A512JBZ6_9HYPH|nr:hypothetical protein [Methylobacterium oxalidis]GEP07484.1 hypothetical protein MOX02_55220 [Methylobacterium oxalidis]GJE35442.1 hypothetical protein LDDCCGHA_5660 [Methylobacterium oxalidis]GLS66049.1 hypothetical protein GCM10007888_44310 [Methylobacterium oxalidis]